MTDYAIYMLDPSGIVTSWNPGAQRFKGYTADEIIGQHFSRFYSGEDQKLGLPARALETAAREGNFEAEGWRIRKDGHALLGLRRYRSNPRPIRGDHRLCEDHPRPSERKAAEQILHRSEEQFRLLVQGVTDYAIYLLDPEGRVTNWNLGAQRIKGFANEIIGQHFSRFYSEEDQKAGKPARALGIASREGKFEADGWRVRKDGTRFWANVVIDAIRDDEERLSASPRLHATSPSGRKLRRNSKKRVSFSSVAEDGGGRPAHRRHRPRF